MICSFCENPFIFRLNSQKVVFCFSLTHFLYIHFFFYIKVFVSLFALSPFSEKSLCHRYISSRSYCGWKGAIILIKSNLFFSIGLWTWWFTKAWKCRSIIRIVVLRQQDNQYLMHIYIFTYLFTSKTTKKKAFPYFSDISFHSLAGGATYTWFVLKTTSCDYYFPTNNH